MNNLQSYDTSVDSNTPYACGTPDFALAPGEGLLVQTKTGNGGDYIIVGSHNPALTINLESSANAGSNSGTERYTHPYHAVSALASELTAELGGCRLAQAVANIQAYDGSVDSNIPYTCGLPDFAIEAGQSYLVQTGTGIGIGGLDFVPAHY